MKINFSSQNNYVKNSQSPENVSDKSKVNSGMPDISGDNSAKVSSGNNSGIANSINNVQVKNLTKAQQALLIKELLDLPKEFEEFLSLITYDTIIAENLTDLMQKTANGSLLMQNIKELLSNNSKEVLNKLLKLLNLASGNEKNTEQLKEIISLLNKTVPSADAESREILTKAILLYLPYLPLLQPQNITFKVDDEKQEKQKSSSENVALIIYISTINLGRFKIIIIINKDNSLAVDLENECQDIDRLYQEQILNNTNQEMLNNKIACKINFYTMKSREEKEFSEKEMSICPISGVSPKIMMTAHLITKVIFELDENISLAENRKKMLS